jgi:hypothetical protein
VFLVIQKNKKEKHTPGPGEYYYNYRRKKQRSVHQEKCFFFYILEKEE